MGQLSRSKPLTTSQGKRQAATTQARAVPLGGRRGHSGYEYHDVHIAQWYAQALHTETTGVVSVQTERRGPVDDGYIRFTDKPDRYEQYKERLGGQRERNEILADFRDRHQRTPDATLSIVTRDAWDSLRELVQYAVSDDGTFVTFRDTVETNANQTVKALFVQICDDVFGGQEASTLTFLRHLDVQDSGPSMERLAQDTMAHYLQRIVQPAAGAFDLLVRLAQTTGKKGTPLTDEEIRAYLTRRKKRVFSLRSTDRLFLTPAEYRRRAEQDVPFGYTGTTVGRETILAGIVEQIAQGEAVIVVSAVPGLGKTRLCLDTTTRLASDDRTRDLIVLFIRPDAQPTSEDLDQLEPGKRYLIVLDNAHEADGALPVLREALSNPDLTARVHVLMTSHPAYAEQIQRAVGTATRTVSEITLMPIEAQDLDYLLCLAPYNVVDEERRGQIIRLADGNPLLAQFAVDVAQSGGDLSTLHSQDVTSRYLERFTAQVGWSDEEALHRYLAVLAALGRVEVRWDALRTQIRAVVGLDAAQEERLLRLLQRAGVVRRNVRSIRLKPDLLRDHILDAAFFTPNRRYHFSDIIVREFLFFKVTDIMRVVADAERRTKNQVATEVLDEIFSAIHHAVQDAGTATRLRLIRMLRGAAFYRPDDALSVIRPIITGPESADDEGAHPLFGHARTQTHADVLHAVVETLGETRYDDLDDSLEALFVVATYQLDDARYALVRSAARTMKTWVTMPGGVAVGLLLLPKVLTTSFMSSRLSPVHPMQATITSGALPYTPTLATIYHDALAIAVRLYDRATNAAERVTTVKAFDRLIEHLWHVSVTPDLRETIMNACDSLVDTLERWARDASTPCPVLEALYEWAYRACQLDVLSASRLDGVLCLPQTNKAFGVYLQLMSFPARYRRGTAVQEIEKEQHDWLRQTAEQITPATLDTWLEMLDRFIDEYSQTHDHLFIARIQALLELAIVRDPLFGDAIAHRLITQTSHGVVLVAMLLTVMRKATPNAFRACADYWCSDGRTDLLRCVAQAMAWTMPCGVIQPDDHILVRALADKNDPRIDRIITPCLPAVGEQDSTVVCLLM